MGIEKKLFLCYFYFCFISFLFDSLINSRVIVFCVGGGIKILLTRDILVDEFVYYE